MKTIKLKNKHTIQIQYFTQWIKVWEKLHFYNSADSEI